MGINGKVLHRLGILGRGCPQLTAGIKAMIVQLAGTGWESPCLKHAPSSNDYYTRLTGPNSSDETMYCGALCVETHNLPCMEFRG